MEGERESEEWKGGTRRCWRWDSEECIRLVSAVGLGATAQRWERLTCDVTTHIVVFVERK